jgi:hypothetical protein
MRRAGRVPGSRTGTTQGWWAILAILSIPLALGWGGINPRAAAPYATTAEEGRQGLATNGTAQAGLIWGGRFISGVLILILSISFRNSN